MALTPLPGSYVRVYTGTGTPSDYSNEAMEVVDMSGAKWGSRAARTVWRIAAVAKRIMDDSETPVFEYDPAGGTTWETLTPLEIWYGSGYIVTAALAAPSVVQCKSGHFLVPTEFFGCATKSFTDKTAMKEITCYGDTAIKRFPTIDDWEGKLEAFVSKVQASATTTGGATNGNVKLYHVAGGTAGNGPTLTFADTDQATLTIAIAATDDITVDLATTAGTPVSTANEVIAALNAKAEVIALGLKACLADGENGTGVCAAGGPFTLASGAGTKGFLGSRAAFRFYTDYTNGEMYNGFGYISDVDWTGAPADLLQAGLTISGDKYKLWHVKESYA